MDLRRIPLFNPPQAAKAFAVSGVIDVFVVGLLTMAALALLAKKWRIAYPVLLVFGGLILGFAPKLPQFDFNPDVVFFFFLPPLLFPAAMFIPWREFKANLRPILLLAVGLVLLTTVVTGFLAHLLFGFPLAAGFVLGAIISPPDAVAASAIADRLRLPRRIVTILEGESLINDATALVAYRFAVAALATGVFSLGAATFQFAIVAIGGILIGAIIGRIAAWIHCRLDDPPVEITISFLTPFLAYLLAERLHVSGVLAVVTAGLILGWKLPEITSSGTRLQAGPFWNMVEFILNGFVFLLIGLKLPAAVRQLRGEAIFPLLGKAALISAAIILVRIAWVFAATYLPRLLFASIRRCDPYPAWRHVSVVAWTGMRGVVSLAAALALPRNVEGRELILFLTVVVIAATLIAQGLTLPSLIRWLGVQDDGSIEKEERQARIQANQAANEALLKREQRGNLKPEETDALERLRVEYDDRLRQLKSYEVGNEASAERIFSTAYDELSFEALEAERKTILNLRNDALINDEALRNIQRDLDYAEARLRKQS
jgi:monovalent cation/hydrogen antiporter